MYRYTSIVYITVCIVFVLQVCSVHSASIYTTYTQSLPHTLYTRIHTYIRYIYTYVCIQVITGSHDSTIKLYDLAAGKCMSTLTQHKKAVRGLCASHTDLTFTSVSGN